MLMDLQCAEQQNVLELTRLAGLDIREDAFLIVSFCVLRNSSLCSICLVAFFIIWNVILEGPVGLVGCGVELMNWTPDDERFLWC